MRQPISHLLSVGVLAVLFCVSLLFGQVAKVPDDAIGLKVKDGIKVVYHIKTTDTRENMSAGVHELLHLVEIYESVGITSGQFDIHAVFDGPAVEFVINQSASGGTANPNRKALATLAGKGVHLEVCGQNLSFKGFSEQDLVPDVKVVLGGQPRVIDLQLQGYAYFRF